MRPLRTPRDRVACLAAATGLGLAALLPGAAHAQTPALDEQLVSTRTMALGGGNHANATGTSSAFTNPAAMGMARLYHIDLNFLYDPTVHRFAVGSVVADSTRRIGAAVAYHFNYVTNGPDDRTGHDVRLAVSATLVEGLSIGLTGRYMDHGGPTRGPNGGPGPNFSGFTLDAGIAGRPLSWLAAGFNAYALTQPETSLAPFALGAGLAFMPTDTLTLIVDGTWDMVSFDRPRPRASGGLEYLFGQVPVRLGYVYDDGRNTHALTAGFGYLTQMFGGELAIRQGVAGSTETTLMLSLRYFHRLI